MTAATEALPERRYALEKYTACVWVCVSNDSTEIWCFHQHVDGAAHGLIDCGYEERTLWRAIHMPLDRFLSGQPDVPPGARLIDAWLAPDARWESPWIEADWYLPTRRAAIDLMLRSGAS